MFITRLRTGLVPQTKTLFGSKVASSAPQIIFSNSQYGGVAKNVEGYTTLDAKQEYIPGNNFGSFQRTTLSNMGANVTELKGISLFSNKGSTASHRQSTTLLPATKRFYSTLPPEVARVASVAPSKGFVTEDYVHSYLLSEGQGDAADNRRFVYFMLASSRFFFTTGIRLFILRLLYSMTASADVLAVARIEVDISAIPRGKTVTITWRGKPVFVRHRTLEEVREAKETPLSELKDPQPDSDRVKDENWSVLLAICTHLGCVPNADSGAFNAFFCPCHGSHYDISGRIRIGPAPLNLEVPKHQFVEDGKTLVLG